MAEILPKFALVVFIVVVVYSLLTLVRPESDPNGNKKKRRVMVSGIRPDYWSDGYPRPGIPVDELICRAAPWLCPENEDDLICPLMGGEPPVSWEALNLGDEEGRGQQTRCDYNTDQFRDGRDIALFLDTFTVSHPDGVMDNAVLRDFCSAVVETCKDGVSECSRMLSVDDEFDEGKTCRAWVNSVREAADSVKLDVCLTHPDLAECECILRTNTELYNAVSQAFPAPIGDQCWYKTCKGTDMADQLITSDLWDKKVCPQELCVVNFSVIESEQVSFEDVLAAVSCSVTGAPPPGAGDGNSVGGFSPEQQKTLAVVTVVIVLLLGAGFWWFKGR